MTLSNPQPQKTQSKNLPAKNLPAENLPLEALTALLKKDLAAVNALILDRMQSNIPLIPELAGHLIAAGGKRIRPLLTLASSALFNYNGTRHYKLAACVEFIHTATLLHDDVVDESDQRRGRASANAIFGNEAAVLVGDFLFSRSFQLMVEDGSLDVLRILSNASAVIAEGEVLQLSTANNLQTTEADYLSVIRSKTAELFAAACEVGARVADRPEKECQALRDYGMNLGIAFQISDDVLDYQASEKTLGKSLGDDFKEGKMTLPVIYALQQGTDIDRAFFARVFSADAAQEDGDFAKACAILAKTGALEKSIAAAWTYAEVGKKALSGLPPSPVKTHLLDLLDFAVARDH